ncbi:hypothetical protein OKA05_15295 [Luteolibacter arcticus]|uniref:DUF1214 domain-containing protein n=1 Tax=Luteolibacter arcticus TaxID=1581411 RepID=A0ABT3GK85_9BACT|nr:Ig-like domain-containing protein [Luteolibacter arcticus]MCW1923933.1 hypothetical protein [Luteolibacter arcticus]
MTLLAAWKNHHWPDEEGEATRGDLADPDRDGITNLVEYALGLNPNVPNFGALPGVELVQIDGKRYLAMTYVRQTDDPRLQYFVGGSGNLGAGSWLAQMNELPVSQEGVSDGFQRVKIRDSVAVEDAPQRFLRLAIVGNQPPVIDPLQHRFLHAGGHFAMRVRASDPNGDVLTLSADPLPQGASFSLAGSGMADFSWTPSAAQVGNHVMNFRASDGELFHTRSVVLGVIPTGTPLRDGWKDYYWPGISDPQIVGPLADPDQDGIANIIENGLGLDPTASGAWGLPLMGFEESGGKRYLSMTYVRQTDDATLRFAVIASSDLAAPPGMWTALDRSVPVDQTGIPEGFVRIKFRDDVAIEDEPRRFLRLRVTDD